MNGRVEKGNASRKVNCKKRSKLKAYKIQKEKNNIIKISSLTYLTITLGELLQLQLYYKRSLARAFAICTRVVVTLRKPQAKPTS